MRSSGPDPVTGPGDVDLDENGLRETELKLSLAPSTKTGKVGDGGLLGADDVSLPGPD